MIFFKYLIFSYQLDQKFAKRYERKLKKLQEKSDEHFEFYVIIEIQMNRDETHSEMNLKKSLK